jgi:hypothetical protein
VVSTGASASRSGFRRRNAYRRISTLRDTTEPNGTCVSRGRWHRRPWTKRRCGDRASADRPQSAQKNPAKPQSSQLNSICSQY